MKKFFTLIAAALMAAGANAQVLSFDQVYDAEQAAGTVNEISMGDSEFMAVFNGGSKAKIASKSLTFKVNAEDAGENFKMQWNPGGGIKKTSGERSVTITVSKKGTLTIYPRSAGSDDRAFTVQQNGATVLEAVAYNAAQFDEKYFKAWAVEIEAGTANILAESAINISALKFEASTDEPGDEPGDEPSDVTTQIFTFDAYADKTAEGAADDMTIEQGGVKVELDGGTKAKIAAKSLTFALATATTDAERETFAYQYCPGGAVTKTSGERSITFTLPTAGTLTIYPRSASGSAEDRTLSVVQNEKTLLDAVKVADSDKVTIGEKEYFKAYAVEVAAGTANIITNQAINFSAFKFEPKNDTTGINTVGATVNNGKWYNLQGQEVAAPTKGLFIKDGKKYVIK